MIGLIHIVEDIMKLSKVGEGVKVILLTSEYYDQQLIATFSTALSSLEADSAHMVAPTRSKNGRFIAGELVQAALKTADIVVSVRAEHAWESGAPTPGPPLYSVERNRIMAAGTRWLDIMLPFPELNYRRLFPSEATIRRTKASWELMSKAKTIRVISKSGTDFTCSKEGRKAHIQVGISDERGAWDNYGFGLVATPPREDSAEGVIVVSPGDHWHGPDMAERINIVREPIKLTFKGGKIVEIEGGLEAKLVRRTLSRFRDEDVFRPAHIGWGTHERAVWTDNRLFNIADIESYLGNMQLHLGNNVFDTPLPNKGLGGGNRASAHVSGPSVLEHDFYLDGEPVIKEGEIVHPSLR